MRTILTLLCTGALLAVTPALANQSIPHQLLLHLKDGDHWQLSVSRVVTNTNLMSPGGASKQTLAYQVHKQGAGYVVTRRELAFKAEPQQNASLPDLSDIPNPLLIGLKDIVFEADANLKPQGVVNLAEIQQKIHAANEKIVGPGRPDVTQENPALLTQFINDDLRLEMLISSIRQDSFVQGVAVTEPSTLPSFLGPKELPAQTTITLKSWDEASATATYELSKQIDPAQKARVLSDILLELLAPLNTLDEAQLANLKTKVAELAAKTAFSDGVSCQFTADTRSGRVVSGKCESEMSLQSPILSLQSNDSSEFVEGNGA